MHQLVEETIPLPHIVDMLREPEEEVALSATVELARQRVGARLAWLMLPTDESHQLHLVAMSEYAGERADGLLVSLPSGQRALLAGSDADAVAHGDRIVASFRPPTPLTRIPEPHGDQYAISVGVELENGSRGTLSVAEPLAAGGFTADAPERLQSFATYVASHLAFSPAKRRIQQLQHKVHQLQQEVIRAEEEERRRIARDLHDEIGHTLCTGVLRLDLAALTLPAESLELLAALDHTRSSLVECADAIHRIIFQLSPPILDDLGLVAALQRLATQAMDVGGMQVEFTTEGRQFRLPDAIGLVIFRVVQEALTNIHKHANATSVRVRLAYAARWLTLRIEDNGVGIRALDKRTRPGLGLDGIRERVNAFGGSLTVGSREGGGTVISAKLLLPIGEGEAGE